MTVHEEGGAQRWFHVMDEMFEMQHEYSRYHGHMQRLQTGNHRETQALYAFWYIWGIVKCNTPLLRSSHFSS